MQLLDTMRSLYSHFKALNDHSPSYLADLLTCHKIARNRRPSSQSLLVNPRMMTTTYGVHCLKHVGPILWNDLCTELNHSTSVPAFRKGLKTHLKKLIPMFKDFLLKSRILIISHIIILKHYKYLLKINYLLLWPGLAFLSWYTGSHIFPQ